MRIRSLVSLLLLVPVMLPSAEPLAAMDVTSLTARLAQAATNHPRLLITSAGFTALAERAQVPGLVQDLKAAVLAQAERALQEPLAQRIVDGRRLLLVSRAVMGRCLALSAAWQLTRDQRYAARAEQELRTVCDFSDWNPSHFLDVAEMALGVAVAYDWLYEALPEDARTLVRQALRTKALEPGLAQKGRSWVAGKNNWTQVCHGGLVAAALVVRVDDPALAASIIERAVAAQPRVMNISYAPDGAYPEGPAYWDYATTYSALLIELLRHGLGHDAGLAAQPGFLASGGYMTHITGPSGQAFNYADCPTHLAPVSAARAWMARETGAAWDLPDGVNLVGDPSYLLTLAFLWTPDGRKPAQPLPLDWHGGGEKPVVSFRSAWNDPRATWLAAVGGTPATNHSHMDVGSFVFEAQGIRWAIDLGMQNYGQLEQRQVKLWSMTQDSERWSVFRIGNQSHNLLVADDERQQVAGRAVFSDLKTGVNDPGATLDLTSLYGPLAATVTRRFTMPGRAALVVEDRLTDLTRRADLRWQMLTKADVVLAKDGRSARLTQEGQQLDVTVEEPAEARLSVAAAIGPLPYDAENPGVQVLSVSVTADAGTSPLVRVRLSPQGPAVRGRSP